MNRIDSIIAASGTEHDLILALLVTFCVSIILTSINSFFLRNRFFKTNRCWLDLIFAIIAPFLPAIYDIQLSQMRLKLEQQKRALKDNCLQRQSREIETLSNSVQQTKEIEVGLEAVMQILLQVGLACFVPYVFRAPSGQTYSYFFGVALLVLKGSRELFVASIIIFFGPFFLRPSDKRPPPRIWEHEQEVGFDGSQCALSPCSCLCHHLDHFHPCHQELGCVHQQPRY